MNVYNTCGSSYSVFSCDKRNDYGSHDYSFICFFFFRLIESMKNELFAFEFAKKSWKIVIKKGEIIYI